MDRSHEPGRPGILTERVPDLAHEVGEIRFYDERVSPHAIVQYRFRQGLRPVLDQDLEQLEGFWRQGDSIAAAEQFVCVRVENKVAKGHLHWPPHPRTAPVVETIAGL